jgi:hypothetical protein
MKKLSKQAISNPFPPAPMIIYEKIANKELYMQEWTHFTERGIAIPNGSQVEPTEWAYQNGVIKRSDKRNYFKVRNHRDYSEFIIVSRDGVYPAAGSKQGQTFWAGFWKEKKK